MKTNLLLTLLLVFFHSMSFSQTPKLYINLGTHNEMVGETWDTDSLAYIGARDSLLIILDKMQSINGKWNFQTCSKFVLGALRWEDAATNPSDLIETFYTSGIMQIDPRNKKQAPLYNYNISDVYHLLDSCGVTSTHTVGGFFYSPFNNEDWTPYRNPVIGSVYHLPWQAEIIWGGGSPNHVSDANDYGVWKPKDGDSQTNFYTHAPDSNLWMIGNGCAPVISDTTTSVQWIVNLINKNVADLENGLWPNDQFYALTVMFNCRDLDTLNTLQKIDTVLNAIDALVQGGNTLEWATIGEKMDLFTAWSQQTSIAYSQWSCDDALNPELSLSHNSTVSFQLFPNPALTSTTLSTEQVGETARLYNYTGEIVKEFDIKTTETIIDLLNFPAGMYVMQLGEQRLKIQVL